MNKREIIKIVARKAKMSTADVDLVVNKLLTEIKREVKKGKNVQITGFGTFKKKTIVGGKAVSLQTKELIDIPPYDKCLFKKSKKFFD